MEALQNHEYSDMELITLIKANNNTELNQYYYELLYKNYYNLFYKLSYKYSNISWSYNLEDLLQESYIAMVKSVKYYNKSVSPFFNWLFYITNQHLFNVTNNGASNKEDAIKKKETYISLFSTINDKDGNSEELINRICDETLEEMIDSIPEQLFLLDLKKTEEEVIDMLLTRREAQITRLYYGFDSIPYNSREISDLLQISKARVTECLQISHRKLRKSNLLRKIWCEEYGWR